MKMWMRSDPAPCLCLGKSVNSDRLAFLSTAAARRGTAPTLSNSPHQSLSPVVALSADVSVSV